MADYFTLLRDRVTLKCRSGLPVAMERKLALRKSAAFRKCHWEPILKL